MTRADFQNVAEVRLEDARILLENGRYEGAYYLCGYAVECALKACIAKATKAEEFPPRDASKLYIHDPERLAVFAGPDVRDALIGRAEWTVVVLWEETSRYERRAEADARALYQAVSDPADGVLACIRKFW